MASPHPPADRQPTSPTASPQGSDDAHVNQSDQDKPRVLRLRIAPWDVVCTVALLALLVYLATATSWPARLFGFLANVCEGETCERAAPGRCCP